MDTGYPPSGSTRPSTVKAAVGLLLLALVIGIARTLGRQVPVDSSAAASSTLVVAILTALVLGFLLAAIWSGRRTAVIVWMILFALGLPAVILTASRQWPADIVGFVVTAAQTGTQVVAIALLFADSAREWFAQRKAARSS